MKLVEGLIILSVILGVSSEMSRKCNEGCNGTVCHTDKECAYGCKMGYYAHTCSEFCSRHCKGFHCDLSKDSGSAQCTRGCIDGFWGKHCSNPCEDRCKICDRVLGHCLQCDSNFYGIGCMSDCTDMCNRFRCTMDGICVDDCVEGYYGENCTEACPKDCMICDRKTGRCLQCLETRFGDDCSLKCPNCFRGCSRENGSCTSGCVRGFCGSYCNKTCAEHCEHDVVDDTKCYATKTFIAGSTIKTRRCFSECHQESGRCHSIPPVTDGHATSHGDNYAGTVIAISLAVLVVIIIGYSKIKKTQNGQSSEERKAKQDNSDCLQLKFLNDKCRCRKGSERDRLSSDAE